MLYGFLLGCRIDSLRKVEQLLDAGNSQEALERLAEYVEKEPQNPKVQMLIGKAYNDLGRYNEAVMEFQNAIQEYTSEPKKQDRAQLELASTYLHIGDRDSALQILRIVHKNSKDSKVLQKIIDLSGDSYTTLQLTDGDSDNYSPTFSPDGEEIAFASFRLENGEIYMMDLSGRITRRVTFSTDFNDSSPTFLNTPNYLFYSSEPKASREIKLIIQSSGSTPIYAGFNVSHIHNKTTRSVFPISFGARVPRSSNTKNMVVYESNADENLELYLLDLSGLNLAEISPQQINPFRITFNETDEGSPCFFPDGKRIIFVSLRDDVNQLYTMDIDGSNEKQFNPNRYDCYTPAVSPDGKTIAFMSARYGDWEIYLIDANGKNERRITNDIGRSIQPTFSPDGRYLAFVSDRSDTFHIYLMDLKKPVTEQVVLNRLGL